MADLQLIDIREVVRLTSLSKTTIYELISQQDFPASIPLTSRRVGWSKADVQEWIRRRMYGQGFMSEQLDFGVQASG